MVRTRTVSEQMPVFSQGGCVGGMVSNANIEKHILMIPFIIYFLWLKQVRPTMERESSTTKMRVLKRNQTSFHFNMKYLSSNVFVNDIFCEKRSEKQDVVEKKRTERFFCFILSLNAQWFGLSPHIDYNGPTKH